MLWPLSQAYVPEHISALTDHMATAHEVDPERLSRRTHLWATARNGGTGGAPPVPQGALLELLLEYGLDHPLDTAHEGLSHDSLADVLAPYARGDAPPCPNGVGVSTRCTSGSEGPTRAAIGTTTSRARRGSWRPGRPARASGSKTCWGMAGPYYSFRDQSWLDLPWGLLLSHDQLPIGLVTFAPADAQTLYGAQLQGLRGKLLTPKRWPLDLRPRWEPPTVAPAVQRTLQLPRTLLHLAAVVAKGLGMTSIVLQGSKEHHWCPHNQGRAPHTLDPSLAKKLYDGTGRDFRGALRDGYWHPSVEQVLHRGPGTRGGGG